MPARHHERCCATPPKLFTFSLKSCSRSVGIGVHVVAETLITIDCNKHLKQRELNGHVVTPEDVPLNGPLGFDIGSLIRDVHEEKGVRFHFGREVKRYDGRELILDDDSVIEADLVVLGVGVTPRTKIAAGAGLECAPAEYGAGVIVNEHLETSVAGIFAIGDIARYLDPHSGTCNRDEVSLLKEAEWDAFVP